MHQIWRLQHFLGVAEHGSFHAAARGLNISQPALTKSIRLLEAEMGSPLFVRLPRGVLLTEQGRLLHVRAREIEAAWNATLAEIDTSAKGLKGELCIGGGPVYSAVYFPGVLARLSRRFPLLKVTVLTGTGTELMLRLRNGDMRAWAGGLPDPAGALGSEFRSEILTRQWNALFVSHNHPVLARKGYALRDLLDYPFLCLFSDRRTGAMISRYFIERDLPAPQIALESHSLQVAMRMILEHDFIVCMPVPLVAAFPEGRLTQLKLDDFAWSIPTGVTYHRSSQDYPPMATVLRLLREAAEAAGHSQPLG
jgi:DNA-binding transcriptional LysR family regulator